MNRSSFSRSRAMALIVWLSTAPARGEKISSDYGPLRIDGRNAPMAGPTLTNKIRFDEPMWLKGFSVQMLDGNKRPSGARGMLCHAAFASSKIRSGDASNDMAIALQDGYTSVTFPEGYALPLEARKDYWNVDMLQSEDSSTHAQFYFRTALDAIAQKENSSILPLEQIVVSIDGNKNDLKPMPAEKIFADSTECGHWFVPPGRRTLDRVFRLPFGGSAKYLSFHVHRYAKMVSLSERPAAGKGDWKLVFSGNCDWDSEENLIRLPVYSNTTGIPVSTDKEYRFSVTYDNPREESVSGMGGISIFIHRAAR